MTISILTLCLQLFFSFFFYFGDDEQFFLIMQVRSQWRDGIPGRFRGAESDRRASCQLRGLPRPHQYGTVHPGQGGPGAAALCPRGHRLTCAAFRE